MGGKLLIQAELESWPGDEDAQKLKEKLKVKLAEVSEIGKSRIMLKKAEKTTTVGFSVKTDLKRLASNPANGRYLGIFVFDEAGELVTEKFIMNPAIKYQRCRFPLVLDFLKQNGIDLMLLSNPPDDGQTGSLADASVDYRLAAKQTLDFLRKNPQSYSVG